MDDVVAVLLDDAMPAARMGELLRDARKRRGWKRSRAAAAVGTTPERLRAYERGTEAIPAEVCARLAERYGDALSHHVPRRVPVEVHATAMRIGDQSVAGSSVDELLTGYLALIARLRDSRRGTPLTLRTTDVTAIATAFSLDREEIESRIAAALGCTRAEAGALHDQILYRKVVLSVAGLAAGVAALTGVALAAQSDASTAGATSAAPHSQPAAAVVHVATPSGHAAPHRAPHTTTTTPTTRVLHIAPVATTPPPNPTPPPVAPHVHETAPAPVEQAAAPPTTTPPTTAPTPDPGNGRVSVLPGETPITIVGPPDN